MRTTITLCPEMVKLIKEYVVYCSTFRSHTSMSSVIEEALDLSLPIMHARIPAKNEDISKFLSYRAECIKHRLNQDYLTKAEILSLLREITRYQDECLRLSRKHKKIDYQECLQKFLEAYFVGSKRIKEIE